MHLLQICLIYNMLICSNIVFMPNFKVACSTCMQENKNNHNECVLDWWYLVNQLQILNSNWPKVIINMSGRSGHFDKCIEHTVAYLSCWHNCLAAIAACNKLSLVHALLHAISNNDLSDGIVIYLLVLFEVIWYCPTKFNRAKYGSAHCLAHHHCLGCSVYHTAWGG